ncbi:hypothetical protein BGZ73_004827 [Actinomortierella ambigua]|nr:hypothetical protein BGZ73_004827 [Actinomortierella ambigua]
MSPPPTSQREDYDKDADTAVAMTDHLDRQNAYGDAALDPVATPSVSQTQVQPVKRKRGRPPKPKPDASQSTRVQDASSSSKAPACPTPPSSLRQLPAADSSNHDSASMSTITVVNGFTWCSRCQSELNQDKAGLSPLDFSHCLHASQGASANVYSKEEGKEVEPGCGCLETLLEQSEGSDHRMPSLLLLSSNKSNQLTPSTDSAALMNEDSDSSAEGGEASTLVSVSPTSKNLSAKPLAKDLLPSDDASATVGEKASAPDLVCESCSRNGLSKVHLVGALHVCSDCADIFRDAGAMRSGRRSTSSLPPVNQKQSGTYNNNAVTKVKKQAGSSNKNASDEKIAGQSQHGPQQDDANHTWSKPRARTRTADDDSIIVVDDDTVLSAPAQEGTFMMPESFTEGMSGNAPKGDKAPLAQSALVTLSSHMSESTQSLDAATTLTPPVPKKRGRPRKVVPIVPPAESSPATKPEISISKKESKVSAATTAAPKTASQSSGTSSTPSFMTTGAFLTRTASKLLLSGQQAQAVDCNVYGYAYGRKVRVRHRDGTFYFGSMIDLDHDRIRVRYDGWSEEWDEWINSESRRLHVLSPEQVKEYEASLQTNDSTPVQATTAKEKKMATEAEAKTKEVVMSAGPQCTGDDEGTSEILASTSNKTTEEDATTNDAAEPPAVVMDDRLEPNNDAEDAHPTSTFHEASNTTTTPSKPTQVEALELHTEDPLPTSCPSPSPENSAPSSSVPSALKAKHKPSTEGSAFQGWRIEALLQASKEESESTSPSQASNPPPRTDVDNNTGATASESTAAAPASTSQTNTTAKTATKKKKLDVSLSSEIQQLLDRVPLGTRVQIRSKNGKQMHDATVVLVHDKKICLHFEQVNARSGMARDDIWLNVTSRRIFVEGKPLRVVDKEKAGLDDGDDGDDDNDGDNGYMGAYSSSDHSRGEKENQPLHADTGSDTAPRRTIEVVIEVPVRKKMADMDPNALLASSPPVTNSKKRKAPSAIVALDGSVERPLTASPADTVVTPSVGVGSPKKKTTKSPKSSTPVSNDETRGIKKGKQKKKPSADAPTPTSETRSSDSLSVSPSPPSQKASTSKNQPLPTPNLSNETEQLSPPPSGSDSISNTDSKKTAKPVQEIPPLPPPLPITAFEFEDQTAEVLKIVHHILDSGAIVNKIIPVQEEEEILPRYFRNMSKARKRKLQELLKDAKEGKLDLNDIPGKGGEGGEAGEGTGGGGDGEGEEDYQPNFDENGEPTEHLLRRLGYHIPSVASEAVTYRDELDGCDYVVNEWVKPATPEVRKIRQDAMRNMTRIPLFQYVRQITYGTEHYDHEIELRDDLTRRKRLAKKLQASSIGLKLAEKIDPEALMNESSETSAKIQKALERYKKKIKKKREKRLLESMKDPDAEETVVASQGKFQNLRSLTRTKKRPRLLKEDHIAFLRKRYTPGTRIRARDKQMEWLVAVVRDLRNSRVLVHYEGFSEYYNEWIDINSERLRFDPTLVQKSPEPEQPPAVAPEEPVPEETVAAPEETPEAGNKKKPRKKAASKKGKEVPPVEEPPAAPKESDQPVFDEGDMISVDCVQCHVQLTQFRYCCTYCEKEEGGEPFNLCLWCFSSAFPEDHDHPRNSFAVKRVLGSNIAKPVAGEIITKFERETFDLTYQEPQMTYQAMNPEDPDSPWNAMDGSGLGNGQAFTFMQQWKQRKICAFCNDDDTTKDHFIGPHPFIFSSTNRYGDEKKKNFWAHDACARYSPEVIQDRNGSWFNVATAMRRGRNNCFDTREIDHDHDKEDFEITSLEMKRKERLAQKAAQAKAKEDSAKKKPVNNRPKFKGLSSKMCSYCWSTNSSKWRKVYNGVLMCEDCFMAGPVINQSLPPLVNGLEGDTAAPEIAPISGGVGRYATNAEDYSHSPYFTRTTVSADRFDHSQSQAVYLDSYGPAEHQLYSLTIDTTYYDIPGRAPRWATHSGTDYHGTWLPQTVRRAVSRWTKPNDRVLSNFLGRGTDAIECFLLGRRCTAVDINPAAITLSIRNCSFAIPPDSTIKAEHRPIIMQGDSRKLVGPLFEDESFDHVLSHPPYKDCVAYSTHIEGDLSRFNNAAEFQREMKNVIQETYRLLKMGRRCTLGIGDNREHCFYIPVSFQLIRQYIDGGFELEELIVKRQRYCAMFGLGTYLCVQFDFLCFTHEFIATLRKVPKENHDRMILEPDDSLLRKIKVSSIVRSIPSCPIERKSVVMGSVWTFKPNKEYDFPTLCISRMVERFGRNDANWEEFKLELNVTSTFNDDDHDEEGLDASYTHHELLQTAQIDEEDNLVSYERDRLQQIQENNRMLLALGLITELSETSDDIGHQQKILREEPCLSDAETALMCIAHVPGVGSNMAHHTSSTICLRTREQIDVYRMAVMDLARKARERLPVTGVFVVGVQDIRTRDNKLYPLSMLVLEDIIRVIGETHLRLKELIEVVPDGYQKDRRKVTSWEEYQEEPNWPEDHIPNQHLPIVHVR